MPAGLPYGEETAALRERARRSRQAAAVSLGLVTDVRLSLDDQSAHKPSDVEVVGRIGDEPVEDALAAVCA